MPFHNIPINSQATTERRVVAILSGKGGTGKSSITTSLGYLLAHCGFKTLLVDLDLFTHGLTFYALGESALQNSSTSLAEVFSGGDTTQEIKPVIIPSPYVNGNLFVLPSISDKNGDSMKIHLEQKYHTLKQFFEVLAEVLKNSIRINAFDYVIIDTRGGTDHTSLGAALIAQACIIVTEADKPSWDMGQILLEALGKAESEENAIIERTGFIINKNVLPAAPIEDFLRRKWGMPHLGTIPLDASAIRFFQEDKVPMAEDRNCPFSQRVVGIARNVFLSDSWSSRSLDQLEEAGRQGFLQSLFGMLRNG